jgi:pyruvate,water dikinase
MAGAAPEYTRPLGALRQGDTDRYGGKSASLGELIGAGVAVPPGFAVSTEAFEAFVADAGLEGTIEQALADLAPDDIAALATASATIDGAMRAAPIPDAVRDAVSRSYEELEQAVGDSGPAVAVRSSARGEDSEEATFAGQQDTFLWIRGVEDVAGAIRDCWASLFSPTAISYRARLGPRAQPPAMGVAVQLMVDAEASGVMFTCNPVSGDPSMIAINACWGLGLAVVGGEVTPDDYLISKVTGEVVRERLGQKQLQYLPSPSGHGTVAVEVPAELQSARCIDASQIELLVALGKRLERHFGGHQDIEWALARSAVAGERMFVLQTRPVTTVAPPPAATEPPRSALSLVMSTFGAPPRPGGG